MSNIFKNNKYLILRRISQITIMFLFIGANNWGWKILSGNLSSAKVIDKFYLADPYMVLQTFATGFILSIDVLIGALIVLLFYGLVGGRSFCSWVCPINIVTDTANWLRKKLKMYQEDVKVPVKRSMRYWILGLGIVLSAIFGVAAFELISPIGMMHRGIIFGLGIGWAAILMVFFFDLFVLQNGFCGHICPLGAFYSLTNRISLFKVNHIKDNCTACNKCFIACPEKQVLTGIINKKDSQIYGSECTNCGRCIDVCEDNSLEFSIIKYKKLKIK